ncbi:hypothetical protein AB0C34_22175 [Nocardia sp. NPDC049220]|uniref:hypothetical protein n=1 Tax=Nocardia sp. NPDC049220 TaxID=3155273 RepID=UPI0033EF6D39
MRRLRAETRSWHDALESTPFSVELVAGHCRCVDMSASWRPIESQQRRVLETADKGYRAIADTVAALSGPDHREPTPDRSRRP